uniref:Uncharacterized protein n=1 Tax=Glossina pallidipes TaxID=7398 RepID=A0A1A9ZY09_GLOPL
MITYQLHAHSLALMASSSNMAYNMAATFQKFIEYLGRKPGEKKKKKALVTKKTKIALIACWPANEKNFGSVKIVKKVYENTKRISVKSPYTNFVLTRDFIQKPFRSQKSENKKERTENIKDVSVIVCEAINELIDSKTANCFLICEVVNQFVNVDDFIK